MPTVEQKIIALSKRLQLAGDPSRLKILCLIFKVKKMCVSDLAKKLGQSVAVTSHHLQALEKDGLLSSHREGKMVCYFLAPGKFMTDLKNFICKYK